MQLIADGETVVNSNNFEALTLKVSKLISRFNELKDRNMELENELSRHKKERLTTKSTIENIIGKMEDLEVG